MRAPLTAVVSALSLACCGAPAVADQAPGRVVQAVTHGAIRDINGWLFGLGPAVATEGGRVVVALGDSGSSLTLHGLRPDGSPDTAFGDGGVARVAGLPDAGVVSFQAAAILRRPDGRLLVVGEGSPASRFQTGRLVVVGFTADGARDRTFGRDGVIQVAIDLSCTCTTAALAPDGSLLLTGVTGTDDPPVKGHPQDHNDFTWVLERLTPAGAPDPAFGTDGILRVPGSPAHNAYGYAVSVLADGRIESLGSVAGVGRVVRLLPDGTADPAFNGGHPLDTGVVGAGALAVTADGSAIVGGRTSLRRFLPDGSLDTSFGGSGTVAVPGGTLQPIGFATGPDGTVYGYGALSDGGYTGTDRGIEITPLTGPGALHAHRVSLGFGGGLASTYRTIHTDFPLPALSQTGFVLHTLVVRPDGSFLALGATSVVQYSGEGIGSSSGQLAAEALTPRFRRDDSFGGPARPLRLSLSVPPQSAAAAHDAHAIRVRVHASAAGLVLLRVRDGQGHVLAQQVQPVFAAGSATYGVQVPHTRLGRVRRAGGLRIVAGARMRDLLGGKAVAVAFGRLR